MELLRVHSQDLQDHVAQEIGECLESGLYTDLAIRCADGQTLHAHKMVLSAASPFLHSLLESNDHDDVQTIEMSEVGVHEMQMLLEVVYNGSVEATIVDLRKLILLTHRLYISIPLSDELMDGLDLKLPTRPPFKRPTTSKRPLNAMSSQKPLPNLIKMNPIPIERLNGDKGHTMNDISPRKLNIDPSTMTKVLAHSRNTEHVCPICNSKYSNVGNFKQHMKLHDNEQLREQRNAILSEMIATCFNPQTSLYTCHVCNSNYNHSGNFKQHLLKHERESGSISATLIAQAGQNPHLTNVLKSAMTDRVDSGDKSVLNQYQYQCEHCDRTFKHPGNYKQHLSSHMKKMADSSRVNDSLQKVNAMFGVFDGSPKPPEQPQPTTLVACPDCHLEFPGIELLQAHLNVSHNKRLELKPSAQPAQPAQPAKGSWHTPTVEQPRPDLTLSVYKCKVCGKAFQKMAKLTAHMKIHRAPEEHYNHPCDICGKKFTRPQHVARHKLLHTHDKSIRHPPTSSGHLVKEDNVRLNSSDTEYGDHQQQFGSFWASSMNNVDVDDDMDSTELYIDDNGDNFVDEDPIYVNYDMDVIEDSAS